MLDELYMDIGGKIKSWAKWIFIIEAIGLALTGFIMMLSSEYLIFYGLLVMVGGPFAAWVGSWILYAFGELVEKTCENENNTSRILQLMQDERKPAEVVIPAQPARAQARIVPAVAPANGWVCTCGRTHQNYEGTCVCGVTKHEAKAAQNK